MIINLGDIITVLTDYHANGSYETLKKHVTLFDKEDYALMVRTTNFEQNNFETTNKYISETAYNHMYKSKVYPYDIIMNKIANAGSVYLMPNLNRPVSLAMNLFLIRVNEKIANPLYVYNHMKLYEPYIKQYANGTATKTITKDAVRNLKFDLPPLKTQTKIANILSAYDDLIENNNQRIKLLEEMAEEIYKEWFVRFRFPNYKNTKFLNKEGKEVKHGTEGALPEGWEKKRIKQIGKVITGKTPSKLIEANFNGHIPFIKTPDMQQGMFFVKTEETLSEQGANSQTSQYIPKNSISVSCIGTVGKIGITVSQSQTNQQINSIIPLFSSSIEYIFFSIKRIKPIIESYAATGATMANLSKSKFENLKFLNPTNDLLKDFHKLIEPIFDEIKILMQKNQVLQETRDLLLRRLISGKLSVEELEIDNYELGIAAEPVVEYKTK